MRTLQNHTALVISSDTQSGRSIAERFAALGAEIVLHTKNSDDPHCMLLASTIKAMGVKVKIIHADLGNENLLQQFFKTVEASVGGVDIIAVTSDSTGIKTILNTAINFIEDNGRLVYLVPGATAPAFRAMQPAIERLAKTHSHRNVTVNAIIIQANGEEVFDRGTEYSDIADAAQFFAGDLAGLVTGQFIVINGIGLPV